MGDTIDVFAIPYPEKETWRCIHCDRIYVFYEDNTVAKVYIVEE